MSASLEFYAATWADVSTAIGSRNLRILKSALEIAEPDFNELFEQQDFEGGPNLEAGLERWINGAIPLGQSQVPFRVDQLGDALGFVALVKYFGKLIGTINHSATAGVLFRQRFLINVAQDLLAPPFPLEFLLTRPVIGYQSLQYPYWGGLTSSELEMLSPKLKQDAPMYPEDVVIDEWIRDLWYSLGSAADLGKDLISVYS